MSGEHHSNGEEPRQERLSESWSEVGGQIQDLVSRLADVFREAWTDERKFQQFQSSMGIEDELRSSADRIGRVFRRVASETEDEWSATMKSTRKASDQTFNEVRVVAARGLRALNEQLDELAKTLDRERSSHEDQPNSNGMGENHHNSDES